MQEGGVFGRIKGVGVGGGAVSGPKEIGVWVLPCPDSRGFGVGVGVGVRV